MRARHACSRTTTGIGSFPSSWKLRSLEWLQEKKSDLDIHDLTFWTRLKLSLPQDELFALKTRKSCIKYYFFAGYKARFTNQYDFRNILNGNCLNLCITVHESDAKTSLYELYMRNVISYVKHNTGAWGRTDSPPPSPPSPTPQVSRSPQWLYAVLKHLWNTKLNKKWKKKTNEFVLAVVINILRKSPWFP